MSRLKTAEWFSIITSTIAIMLAIYSTWFTTYSFNNSKEVRIALRAKVVPDNNTVKVSGVGNRIVVPMLWEITISNNSDKSISVVDARVECNDQDGIVMYSNMDGGLYVDNKRINFPVNLNSGESRKYILNIGVLCDSNASRIIRSIVEPTTSDKLNSGTWTRIDILKKNLAENGIDFYGNKAKGLFEGERVLMYEVTPKKQQNFSLILTTSQNQDFIGQVRLYMND